jgi:peptide deformylase
MIKSVVKWPDPVLLTPTKPWNFYNPPFDYLELEQDLKDTLLEQNGLGLAANQIGIPYRVLAINVQKDNNLRIMYNPEILYIGSELATEWEGCLSFPKLRLEISRPKSVTLRWLDHYQFIHSMDLENIDARCILHEIDHLNGKVFKEYVSDLRFRKAWDKL